MSTEPRKVFAQVEEREVTRTCMETGKEFTLKQSKYGETWFPDIHYCDEVLERFEQEEKRRQEQERQERIEGIRQSWIEKNIPAHYRKEVDRECDLDWERFDIAMEYSPRLSPHLIMQGESRRGKTRAMYELAKRNADLYPRIDTAERWARYLGSKLSSSASSHEAMIADLSKCKMLCIDDLGKDRVTPRSQTDMFEILNHRFIHELPTIITTNYDGENLEKRFPDSELANHLVKRIRDFCKLIRFK